jgi:hypothetical protein
MFSGNPTRLMPPTSSPAPTRRHRAAFTGFTASSPAALGLPSRARWTTHLHRMFLSNPTVQVFQRFWGARVRHEKKRWPLRGRKKLETPLTRLGRARSLSGRSPAKTDPLRAASHQPRLHRADASPKAFGASIGTVPPAPWPDSPALQTVPLRCTNPLR